MHMPEVIACVSYPTCLVYLVRSVTFRVVGDVLSVPLT